MPSELVINVLAGGLAGAAETLVTYPLDLVKTRQQLSSSPSASVPAALQSCLRHEGIRGLYRGLAAPLVSEIPRRALKFTANGWYRKQAEDIFGFRTPLPVPVASLCGALAGATETVVHTPFEVAKVRLQAVSNAPSHLASNGGSLHAIVSIARCDGLSGLYCGFEAYALRQAVWNGVFFGSVAFFRSALPTRSNNDAMNDFFTGMLAGSTQLDGFLKR